MRGISPIAFTSCSANATTRGRSVAVGVSGAGQFQNKHRTKGWIVGGAQAELVRGFDQTAATGQRGLFQKKEDGRNDN